MSTSATAFQPTIEDMRTFFKDEAHIYDMRARAIGECPYFWYLKARGVNVNYVGVNAYTIGDEYIKHPQFIVEFIRRVDVKGKAFERLIISAQECLDILDRM